MTSAAWWIKQKTKQVKPKLEKPKPKKLEWKSRRIYSMHSYDVPDIKWVERFVVGTTHPKNQLTQKEIDKQMNTVNRALRHGRLVGIEQNFTVLTDEKKDIITQYTVYHVGFKHRPAGK